MPYQLRCSICAHTSDVRALAVLGSSVISGSRDRCVKLWTESGNDYRLETEVSSHTKFISSLCVVPPSKLFPQGLIFSGGHDNRIISYVPFAKEPTSIMTGHSGAVCCLAPSRHEGRLLSSSWDGTAKVWDIPSGECIMTLLGHDQSVWSVIQMPENFVTGSADKSINVYSEDGSLVRTLVGHTDCVRALACAGQQVFLSCGNDSTVRKWNITTGENLEVLYCHDSFLYSIVTDKSLIALGGEDSNLTVFFGNDTGNNQRQDIQIPATSVWTVAILPNSDIVTGSSDGYVRIFTQDPKRIASKDELLQFEKELITMKQGTQEDSNFPGREALTFDGRFDGEIKLVKVDNINYCYCWNEESKSWNYVGQQVDEPPITSIESERLAYEQQRYYPPQKYVTFVQYDEQLISQKLADFVQKINPSEEYGDFVRTTFKILITSVTKDSVEMCVDLLINSLTEWPEDLVFPVLDIARIAILDPLVHPVLFNNENSLKLKSSLNRFMKPEGLLSNKTLLFRIFSNMFSNKEGEVQIYENKDVLLLSLPDLVNENKKGLHIAAATFILNMSLVSLKKNDSQTAKLCVSFIRKIIGAVSDSEAIFRLLVALGTLGKSEGSEIVTEDIKKILENISTSSKDKIDKVVKCAQDILKDFVPQ